MTVAMLIKNVWLEMVFIANKDLIVYKYSSKVLIM